MPKYIEENERLKRRYLTFLKEAEGQDQKSLVKVAAALRDFELALGVRPFKEFKTDWAVKYKKHLITRKNEKTGQPLGVTTRDATLRLVKGFIRWLAQQQGFKSRIALSDAAYFNNSARDTRIAHTQRPVQYPSIEQCAHAFRTMPNDDVIAQRDRAVFAFLMLTCARVAATASLCLKHIDIVDGKVFQDGREVRTKRGKTIETWFFPVDPVYRDCLTEWVTYLREELLFGPGDPLFPKQAVGWQDGRFQSIGLVQEHYSNGNTINRIVKSAFAGAGLQLYSAHTFRKTLALLANQQCKTLEQHKAWSQNLGHDNIATTVSAYMPVSGDRQREILRKMLSYPAHPALRRLT